MGSEKDNNGKTPNGDSSARKILVVSRVGCVGDLCRQLHSEGNQVRYFIESKGDKEVSDGFVEKTEDWKALRAWADLVVFDDSDFGRDAETLRREGKRVVGGTIYTDRLEDDRDFGQQEMKAAGMTILPNWTFTSFEEAICFVKKTPDRYVVKPSGSAQNEKVLSYVGQEEDGQDVLAILERYKKGWARQIRSFQIQKFATGVEVAIGAFFNGKEFVLPACVNFEHKKMFNDDIGPATGEMGCYDDKTEVLTRSGWKLFSDILSEDEFASLHPSTNTIEFHRASAIVRYQHHKKMVQIKNRSTDLLITPDHQMFGQEGNRFRKRESWGFVAAKNMPHQFVAPRSGCWKGEERDCFVLPSVELSHYSGRAVVSKLSDPVPISMDVWLAFLGFWLAEGHTSARSYAVGLAQVNKRKAAVAQKVIQQLPFRFRKIRGGWLAYDKRLWSYLRPLGDALDKFIPREYKALSPRQLTILFDHMCLVDGNMQKNGFRIYDTSSKRLADDVQEILLKLGRVGLIKSRLRKGGGIFKRRFRSVHPGYEVIERIKKTTAWLDRRDTKLVDYKGAVYCVTVPYHTLYVRRNGKPIWCGNTAMFWVGDSPLYRETIDKMAGRLAAAGFVGYFDINCIATARAIYPLECTPRFGYPTLSIQMEGVTSRWGDFLHGIAGGSAPALKTKKGFQIGVVIAVPPFPFEDASAFKKYSEGAVVIFKKPVSDGVYPGDIKLVDGDWVLAGQTGYALVVTGSGLTMMEAAKEAYGRVKNIIIPNMFYRTDIGERWRRDGDLLRTWGYLG